MLKIYDIPRYQREYTWNQRDWANLYDDITQNDAGYFLGSFIVVNGTVNSKMDTIHYEVIDGQQRLTTPAFSLPPSILASWSIRILSMTT